MFSFVGLAHGIDTYYGLQYEKSLSNLFGYFLGYMRHNDFINLTAQDCGLNRIIGGPTKPSPSVCDIEITNEFRALIPGVPTLMRRGSASITGKILCSRLGPAFAVPQGTAYFYLRISTTLWHDRGRRKFGNPPR